ncbi:LPXTG-motif cell wall-anchored protein [Streptomyces aurantiacus]|uniref:LAETG motif-containing sortase-dependent surface protein n=1 Tax=Streptomyces aurantiacus TaxID=47760 RepID=UPI00278E1D92|nr:LAETG motif-containing sortase-dependent surface protein [Streptomyces aurantiacus]MDQ0777395.1 LPXTG-motif cell wall-anchored protein [Streptomyces aurantiacus]
MCADISTNLGAPDVNQFHKSAAVVVAALAFAVLPATAEAHDGLHPFENCTEAYENGYANIARGDEHYGDHLDRDQDGVGCDKPPADFVPASDTTDDNTENTSDDTSDGKKDDQGADLAETGGSGATAYIAGGGAVVLLAGGGVLFTVRRRRDAR